MRSFALVKQFYLNPPFLGETSFEDTREPYFEDRPKFGGRAA